MRLPFIGEVILKSAHDLIVSELRRQLDEKEAERKMVWNRLFFIVQGTDIFEAQAAAAEPVKADDKVPHAEKQREPEEVEDLKQASRLGPLLGAALRFPGRFTRQRSMDLQKEYRHTDEKRHVKEMLDLTQKQARADAETARAREFQDAAKPMPTPAEVSA